MGAIGLAIVVSGCGGTSESPKSASNKPADGTSSVQVQEKVSQPAFLDANNKVIFSVSKPTTVDELNGKVRFTVDGKALAVKSILPASKAVQGTPDSVDPKKVVLPGTIQAALGGTDWNPNGDITKMTEVAPGIFEFTAAFPKGVYEYKLAQGGTWEKNFGAGFKAGGENISLDVPKDGAIVKFVVNFKLQTIKDSINNPKEVVAPKEVPALSAASKSAQKKVFDEFVAELGSPVSPQDLSKELEISIGEKEPHVVFARGVLDDPQLQYSGNDLGSRWSPGQTTFKVWSPVSSSADLLLFDAAIGGTAKVVPMKRAETGVWETTVQGDLHGKFYQYQFKSYDRTRVAADINCFAASADSSRSMVVDLSKTNPSDWPTKTPGSIQSQADVVLYEVHVRDLTSNANSGVKESRRGKYLGFIEGGTSVDGRPTGLDYLKDLGVNAVHLLPIQDFNPEHSSNYNWGYETTLFNVPEEQYATDPSDPIKVVSETKSMVAGLHKAGIRVVLDVVYNHTVPAQGPGSAFWETVPYYYFRTDNKGTVLNESGVGNALNDDRLMVRKYVRDSLVFWANEYKVDGFRFDLLGMFTRPSVEDWATALRAVRPDIILYGEPWTGGGPTRFGKGVQKGTGVAVFNDNLRNGLRGELDGPKPGFAMGAGGDAAIIKGLLGSTTDFTVSPVESLNYVSAHDNMTLWDKVDLSLPKADFKQKTRAVVLSNAVVLLAQGVPFIEGGAEIGRTKGGNNNSYNGGDEINAFDWSRMKKFSEVHAEIKNLIAIRLGHPAFRLSSSEQVSKLVRVSASKGLVTYEIDGNGVGDPWGKITVLFANKATVKATAPGGMKLRAGNLSALGYEIYSEK